MLRGISKRIEALEKATEDLQKRVDKLSGIVRALEYAYTGSEDIRITCNNEDGDLKDPYP
jgi:wobble nucleotide-excising tRNase